LKAVYAAVVLTLSVTFLLLVTFAPPFITKPSKAGNGIPSKARLPMPLALISDCTRLRYWVTTWFEGLRTRADFNESSACWSCPKVLSRIALYVKATSASGPIPFSVSSFASTSAPFTSFVSARLLARPSLAQNDPGIAARAAL